MHVLRWEGGAQPQRRWGTDTEVGRRHRGKCTLKSQSSHSNTDLPQLPFLLPSTVHHVFKTGQRLGSKMNQLRVIRVESTDRHRVSTIGVLVPQHLLNEMRIAIAALQNREALALPLTGEFSNNKTID